MPNDSWRGVCAPIIARVIAENQGRAEKDIRLALRAAYPFGERAMWPYKVWCDEVNHQLHKPKRVEVDERQGKLWEGQTK